MPIIAPAHCGVKYNFSFFSLLCYLENYET